jgi:hypothetical protein
MSGRIPADSLVGKAIRSELLLAISRLAQPFFVAAILGIFGFEFVQAQTVATMNNRVATVERTVLPLDTSPTLGERMSAMEQRANIIGKQRDQENIDLIEQINEIAKTDIAILQTLATLTEHVNQIDKTLTRLDNKP